MLSEDSDELWRLLQTFDQSHRSLYLYGDEVPPGNPLAPGNRLKTFLLLCHVRLDARSLPL